MISIIIGMVGLRSIPNKLHQAVIKIGLYENTSSFTLSLPSEARGEFRIFV